MSETKLSEADRKDSTWPDTVVKLTPLLSVIVAMFTVAFSIYQYRSQQEEAWKHQQEEQALKVRSQIRSDLDQLSQFPSNKTLTLSGAEFLLGDLDGLLQDKSRGNNDVAQTERQRITKILYDLVYEDCNYDDQRDVDFSIKVFDSWKDYQAYVKAEPDLIWDLLLQYNDSLNKLYQLSPQYIKRITYDAKTATFTEPTSTRPADAAHLRHFEDLIRGFKKHLNLLDQSSPLRMTLIQHFQASTCNESLTKAEFGSSFDPKSDPDLFRNCQN